MFQPVSLFIGLRYSRAAKGNAFISFISFFSITGIALGITALITVVSVMNGFEDKLKQSMLGMLAHIELKSADDSKPIELQTLDNLRKSLNQQADITDISAYSEAEAILVSEQDIRGVMLQGVYAGQKSPHVQNNLTQGHWQSLFEKRYSLALSRYLVVKLGLKLGDKVRVIVPQGSSYTPMGRIPSQRLFTLVAIYSTGSEIDTGLAFTAGEFVSRLLKKNKQELPAIRIQLADPFNVDSVIEVNQKAFSPFLVSNWRKSQGSLFSAVAMEKRIMSLLLGLIVIVAVFNIVSALTMMVAEKQSEVAILQTIGLTPFKVQQVFIIQGLYNGCFGTLLGGVFGVLFATNINALLDIFGIDLLGGSLLPVKFNTVQIISLMAGSIFMSFIATLYPARKAAQVRPAEVLRYE